MHHCAITTSFPDQRFNGTLDQLVSNKLKHSGPLRGTSRCFGQTIWGLERSETQVYAYRNPVAQVGAKTVLSFSRRG
jgi:hypothetical protein